VGVRVGLGREALAESGPATSPLGTACLAQRQETLQQRPLVTAPTCAEEGLSKAKEQQ
jgi:hypothetical protein